MIYHWHHTSSLQRQRWSSKQQNDKLNGNVFSQVLNTLHTFCAIISGGLAPDIYQWVYSAVRQTLCDISNNAVDSIFSPFQFSKTVQEHAEVWTIDQSSNARFVRPRDTTCLGVSTVVSSKHEHKTTLLNRFLNVLVSVMLWSSEGRVFQADGPEEKKPRYPNLILVLGRT